MKECVGVASPPARQPASPPARQPASPPARQPASPPARQRINSLSNSLSPLKRTKMLNQESVLTEFQVGWGFPNITRKADDYAIAGNAHPEAIEIGATSQF